MASRKARRLLLSESRVQPKKLNETLSIHDAGFLLSGRQTAIQRSHEEKRMTKRNSARWLSFLWNNFGTIQPLQTAIAASVSLAVANLLGMPEAYWAPISTIIVMQSTLGASWVVSKQRFIGTVVGALFGALLGSFFTSTIIIYGAAIMLLGFICAIVHLDKSAYRFSGVTLTIIMLVTRSGAPWLIGLHRFVEVSIGIAVALALAAIWPNHKLVHSTQ